MGRYVEEAIAKYMKDNGIYYAELEVKEDKVLFKGLDADITFKQLREFEEEFGFVPDAGSWSYDFGDSIEEIEFIYQGGC